jgi:hypothetical protein
MCVCVGAGLKDVVKLAGRTLYVVQALLKDRRFLDACWSQDEQPRAGGSRPNGMGPLCCILSLVAVVDTRIHHRILQPRPEPLLGPEPLPPRSPHRDRD